MKNNRRTGEEGSYIEANNKNRYKGAWFNDKKNGRGISLIIQEQLPMKTEMSFQELSWTDS